MAPGILRFGALALRASSTVCPSNPTCPSDDSCTFTTNGASVVVSCATDFYGGDLRLAQTSTLAGCIKACASTTGCLAASYVGQNCYLKSTVTNGVANPNVIGVSVVSREVATPVVSGQTCPSSYSCPENDGCNLMGADQRAFKLSCGEDFYGGDLSYVWTDSYQGCTKACAANSECVAASFTGGSGAGPCYLKNQNNGASINSNVDSVFLDQHIQASSSSFSSSASSTISTTSSTISTTSSTIATTSSTISAQSSMTSTQSSTTSSVSTTSSSSSPSSESSTVSPASSGSAASSSVTLPTMPSSSAVISSTVVTSSSSTIATSSSATAVSTFGCPAPAPTAAVLPTNFCLKVVTPGIASTGYAIKRPDDHVILVRKVTEKTYATAIFNLERSGRLLTTSGFFLAATGKNENQQIQALNPQEDNSRIPVAELRCDVGAGNVLQCAACDSSFSRTVFRTQTSVGGFVQDILRIDAQPTRAAYLTLQFGIFTGADCL